MRVYDRLKVTFSLLHLNGDLKEETILGFGFGIAVLDLKIVVEVQKHGFKGEQRQEVRAMLFLRDVAEKKIRLQRNETLAEKFEVTFLDDF